MERDNYKGEPNLELPELEQGENPIFRVVRGEDGVEREVEDTLLPKLIFGQTIDSFHQFTEGQLNGLREEDKLSTIRRIFRQDGITYQIIAINEAMSLGTYSI